MISMFDQSAMLAARLRWAQQTASEPPAHVALPGAKTPIARDRLEAHQDAGRLEHRIVARINEQWDIAHSDALASHRKWREGAYRDSIELMRRIAAEEAAESLRRRAMLEAKLRAGDAGNA